MDIPRKYIRSHYGKNEHPNYLPKSSDSNKYSMTLFAQVDTENMTIKPDPNVLNGYPTPNRMVLKLSNGRAGKKAREVGELNKICVTWAQLNQDIWKREPHPTHKCGPTKKLCRLQMYLDGWPVQMSLQRELYEADPQTYCNLARDFLNELTIERNSLLDIAPSE